MEHKNTGKLPDEEDRQTVRGEAQTVKEFPPRRAVLFMLRDSHHSGRGIAN